MIFFRVLFVLLCIFGAEYAQPIDARDDIKIILELNGTIIADLDDPDAIKKLASVVQEEETQTENWKPKFKIHFAYILVIVTLTFLPIVFGKREEEIFAMMFLF
uniref:Neur_chan_LBD domain-containing protein n=1 Tax=Caenorhabditis tropicalis TaxID=1561998 RepID=A0A1I7T788_9PELO